MTDIGEIATILKQFDSHPRENVPIFPHDMDTINKVVPCQPVRVILDDEGNPSIFLLSKQKTINALQAVSRLVTTEEASLQLTDILEEETK